MKKLTMSFLSALLIVYTFLPVLSSQAAETKTEDVQTSEIPFVVWKADKDEVSTAGDFVETPAKVVVENGKTFVYATLLQSEFWQSLKVQSTQPGTFKEDNFVTAEVISSDKKENTRVVKFEIQDVTKVLNVKAHIIVTGVPGIGEYDHSYDLRLKFDDSKVPTTPEVIKDGAYTIDTNVLHATEDKASSMGDYVETPVALTVRAGKNFVTMKLTDNEQITVFQVEQDGKFVDATVVNTDEKANTRDVEFKVADLTKVINAKVTVHVAAMNRTMNHTVRLAFDPASIKAVVDQEVVTFGDIQKSDFKSYIESLATKGIIKGKTPTTFAPNDQLTRAQFAVLLSRALDLPKTEYKGTFSDVSKSLDWAVSEIEAAAHVGITTGSNGKFRPNEKVTREQMATMIIRAIEYKDASVLKGISNNITFADAKNIDSYAKKSVDLAAGFGIVSGKEVNGNKVFDPRANATRGQASKVVYYLLEKLK